MSILVVEDDLVLQSLLVDCLEEAGLDVFSAVNVDDAFHILDLHGAKLTAVITDLNLGGDRDGWDVAKRAREMNADIAIICITGMRATEAGRRRIEGSLMLEKPLAPARVLQVLRELGRLAAA